MSAIERLEILPFDLSGGGSSPVQYEVKFAGCDWYIRYRHSSLSIEQDGTEVFEQLIAPKFDDDGTWSDEETTVYLSIISNAIRKGQVGALKVPLKSETPSHPLFMPGPFPHYIILTCGLSDCGHSHGEQCIADWTLSAVERSEWIAKHGYNFRNHPYNRK